MLISTEPATGAVLWEGPEGDAGAEVEIARARAAWAELGVAAAGQPHRDDAPLRQRRPSARQDALRRPDRARDGQTAVGGAHRNRGGHRQGRHLGERPTRSGHRIAQTRRGRWVCARRSATSRTACWQCSDRSTSPAHLPNGHIVPALIAGNAVVFKPSEKTPAVGQIPGRLLSHGGGVFRKGVHPGLLSRRSRRQASALAGHPGIDGLLFTGSARAGLALHQASSPRRPTRSSRSSSAATIRSWCGTRRRSTPPRCCRDPVRLHDRGPALHVQCPPADRQATARTSRCSRKSRRSSDAWSSPNRIRVLRRSWGR